MVTRGPPFSRKSRFSTQGHLLIFHSIGVFQHLRPSHIARFRGAEIYLITCCRLTGREPCHEQKVCLRGCLACPWKIRPCVVTREATSAV